MPVEARQAQFEALLRHPSLWRGRGAAQPAGHPTGFAALDALLPGGGWPRQGLVEILTTGGGHGELALWAPLIGRLTHSENARCCAFIAPPFTPFAPAWRAAGARLDRLLVVRAPEPRSTTGQDYLHGTHLSESLWAMEQSLLSGVCAISFAWPGRVNMTESRRLALAAGRGAALGVLVRPLRAAGQHSAAVLRLAVARTAARLRLQLLKGRGLTPRVVELVLP